MAASDRYQQARFFASRQDGELNEYLGLRSGDARARYLATARELTVLLDAIQAQSRSVDMLGLINEQQLYTSVADTLLASIDAGETTPALAELQRSTETILGHIMSGLATLDEAQRTKSADQLKAARTHAATLKVGTPLVFGSGAAAPVRSGHGHPRLPPQRRGAGAARCADRPAEPVAVRQSRRQAVAAAAREVLSRW